MLKHGAMANQSNPSQELEMLAGITIPELRHTGLSREQQDSHRRSSVIIGHPWIGRAGSEERVMRLIEVLKSEYDVTVATTGGWDLAELNAYYGTQIKENEVNVRIAPVPWPVCNLDVAALRGACFQRFARRIAGEYDVRISAYNPTDWGLPAIHFIADFSWHKEFRERLDPVPGFIYRDSIVRRVYLRIAAACGKPSDRDLLQDDVVIANSRWTADLIQQAFGKNCAAVIYPPVWTEFPQVPWEEKENAFAMIGRIAPEKRIEDAITILEAVRERGHAVRLHLCGEIGSDDYGRNIAQLCRQRADWIVVEGRVSGARKSQILANCRFGIQTRSAEAFGISVAEMVKAGAIVFAPNNGGQVEILDHSSLLFANVSEAVEKIHDALSQLSFQSALRMHLRRRADSFTTQTFMKEARAALSATNLCGNNSGSQ
jgi:glycosyltransferase involved in cell wall biosynthesis